MIEEEDEKDEEDDDVKDDLNASFESEQEQEF